MKKFIYIIILSVSMIITACTEQKSRSVSSSTVNTETIIDTIPKSVKSNPTHVEGKKTKDVGAFAKSSTLPTEFFGLKLGETTDGAAKFNLDKQNISYEEKHLNRYQSVLCIKNVKYAGYTCPLVFLDFERGLLLGVDISLFKKNDDATFRQKIIYTKDQLKKAYGEILVFEDLGERIAMGDGNTIGTLTVGEGVGEQYAGLIFQDEDMLHFREARKANPNTAD